jgi:hypothetical protein
VLPSTTFPLTVRCANDVSENKESIIIMMCFIFYD